jgi:hypothetical protein
MFARVLNFYNYPQEWQACLGSKILFPDSIWSLCLREKFDCQLSNTWVWHHCPDSLLVWDVRSPLGLPCPLFKQKKLYLSSLTNFVFTAIKECPAISVINIRSQDIDLFKIFNVNKTCHQKWWLKKVNWIKFYLCV